MIAEFSMPTGPKPQNSSPAIMWFRDDLRVADNAALRAAAGTGRPLLCIYCFDDQSKDIRTLGGASRWWLHHSLAALTEQVERLGGRLDLFRGPGQTLVTSLAKEAGAGAVFWSRRYGGAEISVDKAIKTALHEAGTEAASFAGPLLHEPWEVRTNSGGGFKVFSAYWRAARALPSPGEPLAAPRRLDAAAHPMGGPQRLRLADLDLYPAKPDWAGGLRTAWKPGETGAREKLAAFLDGPLKDYAAARDDLAREGTSRLSPHLRFGEISPRQIFHALENAGGRTNAVRGVEKFLSELGWREFNYHVLFQHSDIAIKNLTARFDAMPWRKLALRSFPALH